jgi:hypothetical protein
MYGHDTTAGARITAVLLAAVVALSATAGVASAAGETTISVTAADDTLAPGETTTVDVVLDDADGGVGVSQLQVELTDPAVAEIVDIELGTDPGLVDGPFFADDNSSVQGGYALDDTDDNGSITVATVTVEATAAGTTDVELADPPDLANGDLEFADEDANEYTVTSTGTATITVEEPNQPPEAEAGTNQAVTANDTVGLDASGSSDPDGDGLSYNWTQTSGPSVTLSDATAAQPTFAAPDVDGATTLGFEVTVSDGDETDTDTVTVTVADTDSPPPSGPPSDGNATDDGNVSVVLVGADGDGEIAAGSTNAYDVVVTDVDGGVGAFAATVSVDDPSVATVTDASIAAGTDTDAANLSTASVNVTGSSAVLEAALLDTNDDGNVTIGTVVVSATAAGSVGVTPSVSAIGDESGESYAVGSTEGASLSVVEIPTVPGGTGLPSDPDADGTYEDITGDGNVTVADVQTLWDSRNSPEITENAEFYDFNGDGSFDVVDVQALFEQVVG